MPSTEFSRTQADHAYPAGFEFGWWALARHGVLDRALRDAARAGLRTPGGRVLEVGCGPGIVVKALRDRGHDVHGVELGSPDVRPGAAEYVWTGIAAESLPRAEREQVETLMLLDVIEHINDDVTFMRGLLRNFSNCKCIVVTVPARMEVWSNYDEYYGHYRRYDRSSLADALTRAGLTVALRRYFFRSLYAAARVMSLMHLRREVVLETPRFRPMQALVGWTMTAEDMVLGGSALPGMSLLAVATPTTRRVLRLGAEATRSEDGPSCASEYR